MGVGMHYLNKNEAFYYQIFVRLIGLKLATLFSPNPIPSEVWKEALFFGKQTAHRLDGRITLTVRNEPTSDKKMIAI